MELCISRTPAELGVKAAEKAAALINKAIAEKGSARIILSTGASQFETIKNLRAADIDWEKVEMFHLDEYISISGEHPASFVKYLRERFIGDDMKLKAAHFIDGTADPAREMAKISAELGKAPIDVALIGIGENAHIAFNDPPADFETKETFIIVDLDEACKQQQVGEGWFPSVNDVPKQAVTMTPHAIMQSKVILSAVPYAQKARAVKATLENEKSPHIPATILKTHADWTLFLDGDSAALLEGVNLS
ncbi:MAG: 6-phosphogluconolactonase [Defluviitaleaceae bacterium]|nr:6-phosphogluconolactonase [Defluviitaleaceae bacterium]